MARKKKEFHFDFNEDADPVEELHRLREATVRHFKTVDALIEYHLSEVPPTEVILARLDREIAAKRAREAHGAGKKASVRRGRGGKKAGEKAVKP